MVGFPGESHENFRESYEFIDQIGFSKLHVFKYSKRQGTPASKMVDQIPESIKEERSKEIIGLSDKLEKNYYKQFLGKKMAVLIEQSSKEDYNIYQGHTTNYILVKIQGNKNMINQTIPVEIKEIHTGFVNGIHKE
jgi:threonylcarbamoyladenosine tRNA methylthiotransferase MtaB